MKLGNILNETYVVIDPRGNAAPIGSKIQGQRYIKGKKGYYIVLAKNATKARRAIEKAGGNAASVKVQDIMYNLMYEGDKKKDDKEVLLGEGKIMSNIMQTWESYDIMKADLIKFFKYNLDANGTDIIPDWNNVLKALANEIKKAK